VCVCVWCVCVCVCVCFALSMSDVYTPFYLQLESNLVDIARSCVSH